MVCQTWGDASEAGKAGQVESPIWDRSAAAQGWLSFVRDHKLAPEPACLVTPGFLPVSWPPSELALPHSELLSKGN